MPPVHVTPITTDPDTARRWFEIFEGAGLDGIIAKPADIPYEPGKRLMFKIKHARTADVVVAGFRYHKSGPVVGSLLLGLYDDEGVLHHVGVSASFTAARRAELLDELAPYRDERRRTITPGSAGWRRQAGQRVPGAVSRWTGKKDLSWEPLRPELVVEVGYDAMEGDGAWQRSGTPLPGPVALHRVVADLDHELRPQRLPAQVLLAGPAADATRASAARLAAASAMPSSQAIHGWSFAALLPVRARARRAAPCGGPR